MSQSWGVQKTKRSYIEIWLLLLLIFSVNFFDLLPVTRVIGPNGPFTFFLLSLFLVFTFYRRAWISDSLDWMKPFWWFYFGVALSFVPALLYYGQSFTQSFFTNRRMFEFVAFPILIAIRPSEKELRTALYSFSLLYLVMTLLVTFVAPDWVFYDDRHPLVEEGDFVHILPGIRHVSLAFIFALQRVIMDSNRRNLRMALLLFGILFLTLNRTSLFAAIILVLYVIFSMKMSAQKLILLVLIALTVLIMGVYTSGQWGMLYRMTVDQVTNPEYNRVKALTYMFSTRNPLRYLLGEGFISANVSPLIPDLQENGIFHSDVGFVGLWHMYGVIPTLTVLVMAFRGLLNRKKSFLVHASAIYILVGSLTLSFFAFGETLLWLSIYLYMYYSDGKPYFNDRSVTVAYVGWSGRKFRSISAT